MGGKKPDVALNEKNVQIHGTSYIIKTRYNTLVTGTLKSHLTNQNFDHEIALRLDEKPLLRA